jgi:hypothetical protein
LDPAGYVSVCGIPGQRFFFHRKCRPWGGMFPFTPAIGLCRLSIRVSAVCGLVVFVFFALEQLGHALAQVGDGAKIGKNWDSQRFCVCLATVKTEDRHIVERDASPCVSLRD